MHEHDNAALISPNVSNMESQTPIKLKGSNSHRDRSLNSLSLVINIFCVV